MGDETGMNARMNVRSAVIGSVSREDKMLCVPMCCYAKDSDGRPALSIDAMRLGAIEPYLCDGNLLG